MRSYILVVLSFVLITPLTAQSHTGSSWSSVKATGVGVFKFSYVETPRFVYKNASGELTGISVDVMHDFVDWLKKEKNVVVKTDYVGDGSSFQVMYESVKRSFGGVFGLGNITITDERRKEVKFSPPFITNFAILVSHSDFPQLATWDQMPTVFKGGHAYTAKGTTNETRMLTLKKSFFTAMTLFYTTSSQETLERIANDKQGFGYLDLAFYLEAIQMKRSIRRHPLGDKAAEQFGFAMPLNSDWSPVLEEFFNSDGGYLSSSRYRAILHKHLGEAGMKLLKTSSLTNR